MSDLNWISALVPPGIGTCVVCAHSVDTLCKWTSHLHWHSLCWGHFCWSKRILIRIKVKLICCLLANGCARIACQHECVHCGSADMVWRCRRTTTSSVSALGWSRSRHTQTCVIAQSRRSYQVAIDAITNWSLVYSLHDINIWLCADLSVCTRTD